MSEENQTPASTPETGPAPRQTPPGERRSTRRQQKRRQRDEPAAPSKRVDEAGQPAQQTHQRYRSQILHDTDAASS